MAVKVNLVMNQGESFTNQVLLQDEFGNNYDVSGYTASAEMRKYYGSGNNVAFSTSISNGQCTIYMTAAQTANIGDGRWVYDVDIISASNTVTRIVEGIITVKPAATHWSGWPTVAAANNNSTVANNSF